jgi:hypothetical protein
MSGEMDLSLLVELSTGEEATIKEFFLNQLGDIEKASKIAPERREDLVEALTEFFIEQGIQPSAKYDLILEGVSLLAEKGIQLYVISSQNNSILNQLRERNSLLQGESKQREYEPKQSKRPAPKMYNEPTETEIEGRQLAKDEKLSSEMERDYFNTEPTESSIGKANGLVLMSDTDLDIEMENDLTLLNSIETKE